jgi:HK97 gp10 family phage protein
MAADAFAISFDDAGLQAALDEIGREAQASTRPAAQAGAQVLYDEVLLRVPVSNKVRTTKSGRTITPGALKASIYQVYSQDNSGDDRSTYHVSWNYRKAPHGHLVEYGTARTPAHPFLRPAFDAVASAALEQSRVRWSDDMRTLIASFK